MKEFSLELCSSEEWLEAIPNYQVGFVKEFMAAGETELEIAERLLGRAGPEGNVGFSASHNINTYFSNFKKEVDDFLCGHEKYENERAQAASIWDKHGKTGVISVVSGAIATNIGLAPVVLVPVIALFFSAVTKMGLAAYCDTKE